MVLLKTILGLIIGALVGVLPAGIVSWLMQSQYLVNQDVEKIESSTKMATMVVWGLFTAAGGLSKGASKAAEKRRAAERAREAAEEAEREAVRRAKAKVTAAAASEEARLKHIEKTLELDRRRTAIEIADLTNLVSSAQASAARLPLLLSEAELTLDRAEQELAEGLYSPFWEAMEESVPPMRKFEATLREIDAARDQHDRKVASLATDLPPFSIGVSVLPDPMLTAGRMKALYRKAQKNPHFAQVYEQRRTNAILIEGFRSLGDALQMYGTRIESQIERLGSRIEFRLADIETALRESAKQLHEQHTALIEAVNEAREEARSGAEELAGIARESGANAERAAQLRNEYEVETQKMLDNIQRRRRPSNRGFSDDNF